MGSLLLNMKTNILVYGWYNQGNIGDELFKIAFNTLFPDYNLVFASRITKLLLKDASAIFIGGGSFLFAPINMEDGCFDILNQKKIFYIGVGLETEIHSEHLKLMKIAKLVAIRNSDKLKQAIKINTNSIVIPDIVYSLKNKIVKQQVIPKSVLILPNIVVVGQNADPHWKHTSWEYFKSEFSQFLDVLVDNKFIIRFMPMCQNKKSDDNWAATEIINKMNNRSNDYFLEASSSFEDITSLISKFEIIITQRFHGIILAKMLDIPSIIISHHDKLNINNEVISYYGISKMILQNKMSNILQNYSSVLPIENNIFEELRKRVSDLINNE